MCDTDNSTDILYRCSVNLHPLCACVPSPASGQASCRGCEPCRAVADGHVVADRTEAAYRRGDLFEKRRRLMTAWAAYCGAEPRPAVTVIAIGRSKTV